MHIYLPYDHSSALVWVLGSLWVNFKGRNRSRRLPTFVSIAFRDDACVGFLIRQTLFFPFSSFMGASRIPQTFNVIRFICDAMPFNIRLVGNREEKKERHSVNHDWDFLCWISFSCLFYSLLFLFCLNVKLGVSSYRKRVLVAARDVLSWLKFHFTNYILLCIEAFHDLCWDRRRRRWSKWVREWERRRLYYSFASSVTFSTNVVCGRYECSSKT